VSAIRAVDQIPPRCQDAQGHTPLHLAAIAGKAEVVSLLVAKGAALEVLDEEHRTPLCETAKHGNVEAAAVLLDAKADTAARCREIGLTPLHIAALEGKTDVVKLLIERGANINALNGWQQTPLHQATMHGNIAAMKLLIAAHADLEVHDNHAYTPLLAAVEQGGADGLRLLLEAGANPNASLKSGRQAVDVAIEKQHPELVPLLRQHGGMSREGPDAPPPP
jgi:ankyrin repeat protein